jgi:hypothetical protein
MLTEAESLFASSRTIFIKTWAEVKASGGSLNRQHLMDLIKQMDSCPPEDRKSPYYFMAMGMVKKAMGDATAANMFEKTLQLDSDFSEARRELNASHAGSNNQTGTKKLDIFTGDITEIVSHIFRRKAD